MTLLTSDDPEPVEIVNRDGSSEFVLTCEHAGNVIPALLADMGIEERHRRRHIAWDIGAGNVARRLAELLDAPLVLQNYSRLVIDCNRPLLAGDSIPVFSDGTEIPANRDLDSGARRARADEIHAPYHDSITALLDDRSSANRPTALISVHSFTPLLEAAPEPRPWDVGLLFNRHRSLADRTRDALHRENDRLSLAMNEPYFVSDVDDYTIPIHGEKRGIPNMLLEIRNDHIESESGQNDWAELIARALRNVAPEY